MNLVDRGIDRLSLDDRSRVIPFLKWAGGKRWLVSRYYGLFPTEFRRYLEPFVGSGAVFFFLTPNAGVISDANEELIGTYKAIRDAPEKVTQLLRAHSAKHSNEHYYHIRATKPIALSNKAARFIYLNRTCWNGLYRVNKKGVFNVPRGTKNTVTFPSDDFVAISEILKTVQIVCCDFEVTLKRAREGDFIFVDPPYTVKHNFNGFLKYNQNIFTWDDQVRLAKSIERASSRGAKLLVLNANHPSIRELYRGIGQFVCLPRSSVLAAASRYRTETSELAVIVNYEKHDGALVSTN
jgi:DNA adenine methylase